MRPALLLLLPHGVASSCATPTYLGCFNDHEPTFDKAPFNKGPRLLTFGVPFVCTGWGGCSPGTTYYPKKDCPAWPAGVPKCEKSKLTPAYCAKLCLSWKTSFIYSGVSNGDECWCGEELTGLDVNTKTAESDCSQACSGDGSEKCGAPWIASVSQCGGGSSWGGTFLLAAGLALGVYVGGGAVAGKKTGGGHQKGWLASHPHYGMWQEGGALCRDGLNFSRGGGGGGGRRRAGGSREREGPLLAAAGGGSDDGGGGGGSSKRSKSKSQKEKQGLGKSSKQSSKSKRRGGTPIEEENKERGITAAEVPAPPPEWKPTRTGHLAVGARETGVKVVM